MDAAEMRLAESERKANEKREAAVGAEAAKVAGHAAHDRSQYGYVALLATRRRGAEQLSECLKFSA
jgi:hypothetical protein